MRAVLWFLVLGAAWPVSAAIKKKTKKKESISIVDPTLKKAVAPPSPPVAGAAATDIAMPAALAGKGAVAKSEAAWIEPELSQERFAPLDLSRLRDLLRLRRYFEANSLLEIWLALRSDVNTGERLRLSLLRVEVLYRGGHLAEAGEALASTKRYLRLATEDLRAPADRKRVADLMSLVDLTALDIVSGKLTQ